MKDIHRYDLPTGFHSWGHRLVGEQAKVRPVKWSRYRYNLPCSLGPEGTRLTGSEQHAALSRKAAAEGMVLLENNGILPLKCDTTVALFGIGSLDYLKCGGGSGMVYSRYVTNLFAGFAAKEPDYHVYEPLSSFYYHYALARLHQLGQNETFQEPDVPDAIVLDAAARASVAVITVYRFSGEGHDRKPEKGDFDLSDREEKLIRQVTKAFEHTVVVLNIGAPMDVSWIRDNPKIDGALLAWQAGMEGGSAIADILCGDVNPSGKLTDTFARSYDSYPSAQGYFESDDYVCYYEDIYVGYRYFETIPGAKEKVIYPFGYGLSYTRFALSQPEATPVGDNIRVRVTVKNVGKVAGREVVQVYYSAPQGKLGKSALELAAFHKTCLLAPGEQEAVELSFPVASMASYDDLGKCAPSCYVLEQGNYRFFAGTNCRELQQALWQYSVKEEFRVVQQLSRQCFPQMLKKRMVSNGSFQVLPACLSGEKVSRPERWPEPKADNDQVYLLEKVAEGEASLDAFVSQLSEEELIALCSGVFSRGVANTAGIGGIDRLGIPPVMTADGPAGIRLDPETGIATTTWPSATLLACTWDTALITQVGAAGAAEAKENALGIWLAPGMNIHRNPLCGRNFEYFSEDPLLTGKMAAAFVRGVQSMGIAATPKHLACNNKETNRMHCDSRVSERALREIYLRPFELCVKEATPWLIMTAYNIINGQRCCESYELLENILRKEWGYQGAVTSDWDVPCDQAECVLAGNDIRMPAGFPERLREALNEGKLDRSHLVYCVKHTLGLILKLD